MQSSIQYFSHNYYYDFALRSGEMTGWDLFNDKSLEKSTIATHLL